MKDQNAQGKAVTDGLAQSSTEHSSPAKDDLAEYLDALQREACYRVDAVLKESAHETTQRVFFVGANGAEQGPFIRKFIQREAGLGAAYQRLFAAQREGRRFRHLPRVADCYATPDRLAVVMEYVPGETLQDVVLRCGSSLALAADVFPRLCEAVSELHECFESPIIHRDLKPTNIMVSQDALTVIDFGIAREYKQGAQADTAHFGTRSYAPPEQFGFGQTTVRSDVYALGMVLYFCLTGQAPDQDVCTAGFRDTRVPEALRRVIVKAADLNPARRYESAAALRLAFLRAIQLPGQNRTEKPRARAKDVVFSEHFSTRAGKIWNVCLLAFVLLILVVCVDMTIWPEPESASAPLWYRALENAGLVMPSVLVGVYLLSDKRRLKKRIPILARLSFWQKFALGAVLVFGIAAVVVWIGETTLGITY